jgi:hypothetical protein
MLRQCLLGRRPRFPVGPPQASIARGSLDPAANRAVPRGLPLDDTQRVVIPASPKVGGAGPVGRSGVVVRIQPERSIRSLGTAVRVAEVARPEYHAPTVELIGYLFGDFRLYREQIRSRPIPTLHTCAPVAAFTSWAVARISSPRFCIEPSST